MFNKQKSETELFYLNLDSVGYNKVLLQLFDRSLAQYCFWYVLIFLQYDVFILAATDFDIFL